MLTIDKINKLQQENVELKAENDRLIEEIKEVKKYQYEQEYLDKEIEEMQKALKTLAEGLNKRQMLLQEIKEIAETCMSKDGCFECKYSDDCWIEDAEFPTYDICKLLIQKLTKAEEE